MIECPCARRPACEEHPHYGIEYSGQLGCHYHGHVVLTPPNQYDGPACIWCNAPTRRDGGCFTCIACGSSTSC